MAQRVETLLVDDVDGGEAHETIEFAIDGVAYEIDLSDENAEQLRDGLAPYINAGRRVGGRRKRAAAAVAPRTPATVTRLPTGATPDEVRSWARGNGYEVSARGRVPAAIREAFEAAH